MLDNSEVFRLALPLFQRALASPAAESVRRWLVDVRGLRPATVHGRGIGVYPGARTVVQYLLELGVPQQAILQSGLLRRDIDGALVIPWLHDSGAPGVLVFRRIEDVAPTGAPKSKTRYVAIGDRDAMAPDGLKEAAAAGVTRAVIVEGTFDFLQARQQGEIDVLTPHSCAIRPAHFARLEAAGVREVVFAFDSDDAGRRATLTAIELAMSRSWRAWVASPTPEGVDADEFVRTQGVGAWRLLVARSAPALEHYSAAVISRYGCGNAVAARAACLAAGAAFHVKRRPDMPADDLYQEFWPSIVKATGATMSECRAAVAIAYEEALARRSDATAAQRRS